MREAPLRELKRQARWERRQARRFDRGLRRARWRCFWTWPLGHEYIGGRCIGCGLDEQRERY